MDRMGAGNGRHIQLRRGDYERIFRQGGVWLTPQVYAFPTGRPGQIEIQYYKNVAVRDGDGYSGNAQLKVLEYSEYFC